MSNFNAPRVDEILHLLKKHSVLSVNSTDLLLKERIHKTHIRSIFQRLTERKIIQKKSIHLFNGHCSFYELTESAKLLFNLPSVHWSNYFHHELCSLTHGILEKKFPNCFIFREYEIPKSQTLSNVLHYENDAIDSLPDLLLVIPGNHDSKQTYIAVEVERTTKSKQRIHKKFLKYAAQTSLDGVIYLSEDKSLLQLLRLIYRKKIMDTARRVKHYKNYFFMTGACPSSSNFVLPLLQNIQQKNISLKDWSSILHDTNSVQRNDKIFEAYDVTDSHET